MRKLEQERDAVAANLKAMTATAASRLEDIHKFRQEVKQLKEQLADEAKKADKAGSREAGQVAKLRRELDELQARETQGAAARADAEEAAARAQREAQQAAAGLKVSEWVGSGSREQARS
jgi:hypothetical protein